ncbi:uncharacterized protein M6B38_321800 [Iris pallida]|uniref:Uncharacterized protein n=1 Tax=Iris pallida TaxID=29817 RepID=A0AAX6HAU1_IRIPA|nr:uncharacterized protein M6B38_321800 [Iris pallida]
MDPHHNHPPPLRPLWDFRILNTYISEEEAVAVLRVHHSFGDGIFPPHFQSQDLQTELTPIPPRETSDKERWDWTSHIRSIDVDGHQSAGIRHGRTYTFSQ